MRVFQILERRMLLSGTLATVTLSSEGLLHVSGVDFIDQEPFGSDIIGVASSGNKFRVTLNGKVTTYSKAKVRKLLVDGGRGNDTIEIHKGVDVPTTLRGGDGNDLVSGFYRDTVILSDYQDAVIELPNGGVLKYQWEGEGPQPKINYFAGVIVPSENGELSGVIGLQADIVGVGGVSLGFIYSPHLVLSYTAGSDTIQFSPQGLPIVLDLGGGDDIASIISDQPSHGHATLLGGNGNDSLSSEGNGTNELFGGKGNDLLISSPGAQDTLSGGGGTDTADYSNRSAAVRVTLDNQANDGSVGEHDNVAADIERILGGAGNDYLQGGPFNEYLAGNEGDDTLWGGAGDDTLAGGGGKDHLFGQDGQDQLEARRGSKDFLDGGDGSDSGSYDLGIDVVKNVENILP